LIRALLVSERVFISGVVLVSEIFYMLLTGNFLVNPKKSSTDN